MWNNDDDGDSDGDGDGDDYDQDHDDGHGALKRKYHFRENPTILNLANGIKSFLCNW